LSRVEVFGGYSFLPKTDKFAGGEHGHGWAAALTLNLSRHWALVVDVDRHAWTYPGTIDSVDLATLTVPAGWGPGASYNLNGDEGVTLTYVSAGARFHVPWRRLNAFGLALTEIQTSQWSEKDLARVCRADDAACVERLGTAPIPGTYSSNQTYLFHTWDRPLERYGNNVVGRERVAEHSSGAWGFGVGCGADLSLGRRFSVRLIQVNYSLGGFGEGPNRKLRIKTGMVVKFG